MELVGTKGRVAALSAALAAVGIGAVFLAFRTEAEAGVVIPYRDGEAVARGAEIYVQACASCHGAALEGAPDWRMPDADGYLPAPPHDATGHTWHHADAVLFAITKYGSEAVIGQGYRSRMIGFGDSLSDEEILATLAYIKSTWPPEIIEIHNRINRDAR